MQVGDLVWIKSLGKLGIVYKLVAGEYWVKQPDCYGYYICKEYQLEFVENKQKTDK